MLKRNVKDFPLSNVDYLDIHNQARSTFEDFAAFLTFRGTVPRSDGTFERTIGAVVSPNLFRLMGQPIVAGRDFTETDGTPRLPADASAAPDQLRRVRESWHDRSRGSGSVRRPRQCRDGTER
jgi:hypothetical protein